ncbi:DUF3995 domain-containing protein [Leptospira adleri]|uniref:DUF3995 domain-containing protein n=1 Tax=Leptospira adleri TaxID=2023186 RepID=A0A2M9YP44_9LEPT|nr:DUF3995 domain-containing protein [Leptospira adleri]PJZ53308.1 hypothetical protein CH380_10920 [Leptospira adleri]PJZ63884.1 hypothetical protein CH376_00190 [Leptospira adleri]
MTSLQPILSWTAGLILLFLSGIHFYWLSSGQTVGNKVIPTVNGKSAFQPGKFATATVGILLLVSSLAPIGSTIENPFGISKSTFQYGSYFLSAIFFLRAMGEFRLVGFFKSVKGTSFAEYDTKYYSPLCLFLSVLLFLSAI